MSLREWLPITRRNRVALGLATVALVMFAVWNCLPWYEFANEPAKEIAAMAVWPYAFSPDDYIRTLKSPDIEGFLTIPTYLALILCGLINLTAVPCWKILHASSFIRIPLAFVNLIGGAVILWFL